MTGADAADLDALATVLARWTASREQTGEKVPQGRLTRYLDAYQVIEPRKIKPALRAALTGQAELEQAGYLRGPVCKDRSPALWPVATVHAQLDDGRLEVQLKVALFFEIDDNVHVRGWRFETAETAKGCPHPYPHCQPITGFQRPKQGSFAPEGANHAEVRNVMVNEMRPAFPLPGNTPAGLAICMLAAIYGAPWTKTLLEAPPRLNGKWLVDQQTILG